MHVEKQFSNKTLIFERKSELCPFAFILFNAKFVLLTENIRYISNNNE